jgi:adenylyltransferase/sulfurtransferase
MSLSSEEIERYARHIVLREIGGPGQHRLKGARVLVVGAGGLGSPLTLYLAAAGVGTIGIVDDDRVSLSNLQRQILFRVADVGRAKVERAAEALGEINAHVHVEAIATRLTEANAPAILPRFDVVADGSDNFQTRYLVSDLACRLKIPLVTAALGTFDATMTTLRPFETGPDGTPNPTYRCLFPEPPPAGVVPSCAQAGVIGALAGMVGSMMALEVIRQIVPFGESLVGRLLMIDARDWRFETMGYAWDADNPLTGATRSAAPP